MGQPSLGRRRPASPASGEVASAVLANCAGAAGCRAAPHLENAPTQDAAHTGGEAPVHSPARGGVTRLLRVAGLLCGRGWLAWSGRCG
jgi:hypothetical protein